MASAVMQQQPRDGRPTYILTNIKMRSVNVNRMRVAIAAKVARSACGKQLHVVKRMFLGLKRKTAEFESTF